MNTRLRLLVWCTVTGGLLTSTLTILSRPHPTPSLWALSLTLALYSAAMIPGLPIRTGSNIEQLDFTEAVFPAMLVLIPGPWIGAVSAGGALIDEVRCRRHGAKAAFNVGSAALATGTGAWVALAFGATGHLPRTPRDFLGLTLGFLTEALVGHLLVSSAVVTAQHTRLLAQLRRGAGFKIPTYLLNLSLGLGVVALASYSPLTLGLVPVIIALVLVLHRKHLREESEREISHHLLAAGRELSHASHSIQSLLAVAVPRAARLVSADWVSIDVLADPYLTQTLPEEPLRAGARPAPRAAVHEAQRATGGMDGLQDVVEITALGLLNPAQDEPWTEVLHGPEGDLGVLRLGFTGGRVPMTGRHLEVVAQYARSLETALTSARLQERTAADARLRAWEAGHDPLTGLANRTGLLGQSEELAAELAQGNIAALILVDLDRFKRINEHLGHASADELLRHVARNLAGRARAHDTLARIDGDSFAVLLRRLPAGASVDRIAEEMLDRLTRPQEYDGLTLSLDCTLGYVVAPEDGTDVGVLLNRAEQALRDAKAAPGSVRRWRAAKDAEDTNRIALTAELRKALDEHQIVLHYQSQSDLRTGEITAVEALARWEHPVRGLLQPKDFIPVIERSSLARAFTVEVLDVAIRAAARWRELGMCGGALSVAVNLSARNLLDAGLPDDVAAILSRHRLPPAMLILEITETVMMSELDVVETVLGRLTRLGVRLSADDFGTGYSSMALLQRIRVNELKVDQRFVDGMLHNDEDAAIIRATVGLAHSLGIEVVAEGVERPGQAVRLRELGCDRGQGFALARPVTERELCELLLPDVSSENTVVSLHGRRRRVG
jgi:diguanylate cyclase (GGDEF)-like protein